VIRPVLFTSMFFDPQTEREISQRRAAAELPAVLEAGRGLPPVAWTLGTAGATLTGRLPRSACATSPRAAFEAWRQALGLTPCVPAYDEDATEDRTCTYLSASGTRGGVRVHLSATVNLDDHHENRNDDHENRDDDGDDHDSRDGDGEYRRRAGS
jgi:hypothetical protein